MDLKSIAKEYLKKENIIGVGLGKKIKSGKKTNRSCITMLVTKKEPANLIKSRDLIPKRIERIETDVIEVGIIKALPRKVRARQAIDDYRKKTRPAIGGTSIGHEDITAGTLGCIVYRNKQPYILSNNHVLANSNEASKGDAILQPGRADDGKDADKIAELEEFVPIHFREGVTLNFILQTILLLLQWLFSLFNVELRAKKRQADVNFVDAAIAKPMSNNLVKDEILKIGQIKGVKKAELGMKIQKSGRTTGYTTSEIEVTDATVTVSYGFGKDGVFEDQLIGGPMSEGGDSGSAILDMNNNLIGLLFAGSSKVTIMNPIDKVFESLNVGLKK